MARLAVVAVVATVLAALALALAPETASAAISCNDVTSALVPCLPYATGKATAPSDGCCGGVRTLSGKASTAADRRAACGCLKSMATTVRGVNMGNVASVPGKCKVSVGFPISSSVDCSKIN